MPPKKQERDSCPNDHFAPRFVKTQDGELTYQSGLCGYLPNSTNKSIGYAKNRVCMHIKNVNLGFGAHYPVPFLKKKS